MYAPPCSWRTGTNWIEELASDSLRSSVSSPGIPNTYRTPSDSRHSTNTSDALRSLTCTILGIAASLALAAPASAASVFYVRGGGYGHGVGMSQYGAYGYALHGATYQTILGHYYQGTTLAATSPTRIVRVLLKSGSPAFSGATRAGATPPSAATTGQIVTYGGRPAITYFFASSGGYTENVENVFGGSPQPWLRGVPDPYDGAGGDPYHHWGYRMSVAAAAGKLSGLVKGSLVGIKVLRHGASPRILAASVVGTKGRTTVSGTGLQQRFGLLTTSAHFTTITTNAGAVARTARGPSAGHSLDVAKLTAATAAAVSDYVHQVLTPGVPIVY